MAHSRLARQKDTGDSNFPVLHPGGFSRLHPAAVRQNQVEVVRETDQSGAEVARVVQNTRIIGIGSPGKGALEDHC